MATPTAPATQPACSLLTLLSDEGTTQWAFASPLLVVRTRSRGRGLLAARAFDEGEVLLADRWLVGVPTGTRRACEQCLRVCAWSPIDESCRGCGARYCSAACRDLAWQRHHQLLCPAVAAGCGGSTHPLDVFAKHAQLAPKVLEQSAEEVVLAARMLALCALWEGGEAGGGTPPTGVPPPFDGLSSYCVVGAAREAGKATDASSARSKWLGDSYRLLAASALGKHARFAARCPPHVYSHCLGLIDRNAASVRAVAASQLHAAQAGRPMGRAASAADVAEGIGVYPIFSFANHSCAPNAVNAKGAHDGDAALDNCLLLRAARRVEAGEEILFDYLDSAHEATAAATAPPSAKQRQAKLRENFGFECACQLCVPAAAEVLDGSDALAMATSARGGERWRNTLVRSKE